MTQSKVFSFLGTSKHIECWNLEQPHLPPPCPSLLHSAGGPFPAGPQRCVWADSAASGQPSVDDCPTPNTQPRLATRLTGPERGQGLSEPRRLWEALTTRWSLTSKPWAWAPSQHWVHPGLQPVLSCISCGPRALRFVLAHPALPLLQAFMGLLCFSNNKRHQKTQGEKALSNLLCSAYSKGQTADKDCSHSFLTVQPGSSTGSRGWPTLPAPTEHLRRSSAHFLFVFISPC